MSDTVPPRHKPDRGLHLQQCVAVLATGAAVFAAAILLRTGGLLTGPAMPVVLVVLLLLAPVGRSLSRRILLMFPLLLGGVPMLWWIPWPNVLPDRGTLILAAAMAGLAAWAAWAWTTRRPFSAVIPEFRPLDAIPLLAGAAAAGIQWNLLSVRSMDQALSLLIQRWDNASHFNIFFMLRSEGQVIPLLPASPDGSAYSFNDYPQGLHALMAALADLIDGGKGPVTASAEVINYANLTALVVILAVMLVTAGLCALPFFRRHQAAGAPVAAAVAAGWVYGPGALAYMHGFVNFFLAVALAAALVTIAISMDRVPMTFPLAAAAAASVGIANNWLPLMAFVPGCLAVACMPGMRARWRSTRWGWFRVAVLLAAAAAGVGGAVYQVTGVEVNDVLTAESGFPALDAGLLWLLLFSCTALYVAAFRRSGTPKKEPAWYQRTQWTVLPFATGVVVAAAMATLQISDLGELSYYALKLLLAMELMSLVLLGLLVILVVDRFVPGMARRRRNSKRAAVVSVAAVLAATQLFGSTVDFGEYGLDPTAPAALEREEQDEVVEDGPHPAAEALIRVTEDRDGQPAMYLTTAGRISPVLAQQWYGALTRTYTEKYWGLSWHMFPLSKGTSQLWPVFNEILDEEPDVEIVVDAENEVLLNSYLQRRAAWE